LTRKGAWFLWEPLVSSVCEATVSCWATGMTKRKLESSWIVMDGPKLGEGV